MYMPYILPYFSLGWRGVLTRLLVLTLGSGWLMTFRVSSLLLVACLSQMLWKVFRAAADVCHA